MGMGSRQLDESLDRYITGNYGEDQVEKFSKITYAKSLQGKYWNNLSLLQKQELLSKYFKTKKLVEKYSYLLYHQLPKGFTRYFKRKLEESFSFGGVF